MRTFISFAEALDTVLSVAQRGPSESVPLDQALGRTIAEPVVAPSDLPPFASSAMDGFAVISSEVGPDAPPLKVIAHIAAGDVADTPVEPGTCMKIMTGAPFPEGADSVAPIEWVARHEHDEVTFSRAPDPGKHVRPAGEDVAARAQVFSGGERISPSILGMLASLGADPVSVTRQPRVAVISTGDEIVPASQVPGPGQIRNSNGPSLAAQVQAAGGIATGPWHAPDEPDAIRELITSCLSADQGHDVLVFSGGVSVGDHDHVQRVLNELGATISFWKVRQRPGKPLLFGSIQGIPFLGLPGNPVSSAMCFEVYVRPLLFRMLGREESPQTVNAVLARDIRKVDGLHFFTRGIASVSDAGTLMVRDTGPQRSNLYGSVVRANCIMHLPEAGDHVPEGTLVSIEWLPWADRVASDAGDSQ